MSCSTSIERGHEVRRGTGSADGVEPLRPVRIENRVVRRPSAAGWADADRRDLTHVAVADVDRHELAVREEAEAPRIGSPEGLRGAVGLLDALELRGMQRTQPQRGRPAAVVARDEGQRFSVRG